MDAVAFVGLEARGEPARSAPSVRRAPARRGARAVVGQPRVVLLDEPAAGLPDDETEHLGRLIRRIPEEVEALVVLVDHDMSLVSACCATTAVLDFGKLIASGTTAEVLGTSMSSAPTSAPRRRSVTATGTTLHVEPCRCPAGRPVLRDVSLEIPPGEVTALLGPNGAGKSTLVLTVAACSAPAPDESASATATSPGAGRSRIRRAGVAVVAEGRRVLPQLSVADNLRVATYGLDREQAQEGMDHALELFPELARYQDTTAGSLSGGEQQMVVLAQALVSRPRVLLVDELSLGLAPVVVKRLVPTLASVAASGVGVLLIEQFAHVALGLANTAYILEGGRIRYHGTAGELKAHPELLHSAYLLRV